jgi:cysteine desulfurase
MGLKSLNKRSTMSQPIFSYFDNNATTRVAPEVVEAMLPYLTEHWGNPSSAYSFGNRLARPLDHARNQVGSLINAEPREIIFTSCGTESINTAIHSALLANPGKRHLVTTAVEHSATLKFCAHLERMGFSVTYLPVSPDGALELSSLEGAITDQTALVSVMLANNETGTIFPVGEIAALCQARGVMIHTDAVQAAGKLPLDVKQIGVDFLSLSAHKIHAPKGLGALYVRRQLKFFPYLIGGGQEHGRRGGTENVAGIVAFGTAARLALERLATVPQQLRTWRDRLEKAILTNIPGTSLNGHPVERLPNTTNVAFEGLEAEGLLLLLDQAGICASSGSACTTGSLEPSHVLTAMGRTATAARSSLRFSLGAYTTEAEIDYVIQVLPQVVERLRASAPPPEE